MENLSSEFRRSFGDSAEVAEITGRAIAEQGFNGTEYAFYGNYVPIRPIIDTVAAVDGRAIKNMSFVSEEEDKLLVTVVELPEQSHPAFI